MKKGDRIRAEQDYRAIAAQLAPSAEYACEDLAQMLRSAGAAKKVQRSRLLGLAKWLGASSDRWHRRFLMPPELPPVPAAEITSPPEARPSDLRRSILTWVDQENAERKRAGMGHVTNGDVLRHFSAHFSRVEEVIACIHPD